MICDISVQKMHSSLTLLPSVFYFFFARFYILIIWNHEKNSYSHTIYWQSNKVFSSCQISDSIAISPISNGLNAVLHLRKEKCNITWNINVKKKWMCKNFSILKLSISDFLCKVIVLLYKSYYWINKHI